MGIENQRDLRKNDELQSVTAQVAGCWLPHRNGKHQDQIGVAKSFLVAHQLGCPRCLRLSPISFFIWKQRQSQRQHHHRSVELCGALFPRLCWYLVAVQVPQCHVMEQLNSNGTLHQLQPRGHFALPPRYKKPLFHHIWCRKGLTKLWSIICSKLSNFIDCFGLLFRCFFTWGLP